MIQKTNSIRRWKQWLALPLLGVLFIAVACLQSTSAFAQTAPGQLAPPPPPPPPTAESIFTYVEEMPQLPGGGFNKAIVEFIQQHLVYPSVNPAGRKEGQVFVDFTVTKVGKVKDIKIIKGLSAEYDAAVIAAVQQLPQFTPGMQRFPPKTGKKQPVNVSFTVPITFTK